MSRRDVRSLRDDAAQAAAEGKPRRAVEAYLALEQMEPQEPSWPKRAAEMYRRLDRTREAIAAYERAVDRYVQGGFMVQAIAVCKVILQLDPASDRAKRQLATFSEQQEAGRSQASVLSDRHHSLHSIPVVELLRASGGMPGTPPARPRTPTTPPAVVFSRPAVELPPPTGEELELETHDHGGPFEVPIDVVPPDEDDEFEVRTSSQITIDPGAPLDSVELADVMPGAERERNHHGDSSGIIIIPLDDEPADDSPSLEIHAVTVAPGDDSDAAIEVEPVEDPEELSIDDLEEVPLLAEAKPYSESARKALAATPLFASLSPAALESLIEHLALVDLVEGDVLFHEGDPGDSLYVVVEGEVAVVSEGPPRIEVSRLGPGAFFGEVALVTEQPRSATIEATTVTQLLAIDRDVIATLVAEHADVLPVILRFLRERLVDRLVQTHPLFASFGIGDREYLVGQFKFLEIEPGSVIVREGGRPAGLYAILSGRAEVTSRGARVATFGPGDLFGEVSLLTGEPSPNAITASGRCLALCMPSSAFREIIMTHPQVLSYVGDLADERKKQLVGASARLV